MTAATVQHGGRLGRNYHRLFGAATISNLGDGVALVAYPWLASAITRNPLLIAIIVVVQRLPWLLFALPAGVLTDRHDRRLLMIGANSARAVITVFVAIAVVARGSDLPGPDELDSVVDDRCVPVHQRARRHVPARYRRDALRQLCPDADAVRSSAPTSWRRPTAGCGPPKRPPTSSPGRRSGRCCSLSASPSRSSSTPDRSSSRRR